MRAFFSKAREAAPPPAEAKQSFFLFVKPDGAVIFKSKTQPPNLKDTLENQLGAGQMVTELVDNEEFQYFPQADGNFGPLDPGRYIVKASQAIGLSSDNVCRALAVVQDLHTRDQPLTKTIGLQQHDLELTTTTNENAFLRYSVSMTARSPRTVVVGIDAGTHTPFLIDARLDAFEEGSAADKLASFARLLPFGTILQLVEGVEGQPESKKGEEKKGMPTVLFTGRLFGGSVAHLAAILLRRTATERKLNVVVMSCAFSPVSCVDASLKRALDSSAVALNHLSLYWDTDAEVTMLNHCSDTAAAVARSPQAAFNIQTMIQQVADARGLGSSAAIATIKETLTRGADIARVVFNDRLPVFLPFGQCCFVQRNNGAVQVCNADQATTKLEAVDLSQLSNISSALQLPTGMKFGNVGAPAAIRALELIPTITGVKSLRADSGFTEFTIEGTYLDAVLQRHHPQCFIAQANSEVESPIFLHPEEFGTSPGTDAIFHEKTPGQLKVRVSQTKTSIGHLRVRTDFGTSADFHVKEFKRAETASTAAIASSRIGTSLFRSALLRALLDRMGVDKRGKDPVSNGARGLIDYLIDLEKLLLISKTSTIETTLARYQTANRSSIVFACEGAKDTLRSMTAAIESPIIVATESIPTKAFRKVFGALAFFGAGLLMIVAGVAALPGVLLTVPLALALDRPNRNNAVVAAAAIPGVIGSVVGGIPLLLTVGLYRLNRRAHAALKDPATRQYAQALKFLLCLLDVKQDFLDEVPTLEDHIVKRFAVLSEGKLSISEASESQVRAILEAMEKKYPKEVPRLFEMLPSKGQAEIIRWVMIVGRLVALRVLLARQCVISFVGSHNAGKSTLIQEMFGFQTNPDLVRRTEVPSLYRVKPTAIDSVVAGSPLPKSDSKSGFQSESKSESKSEFKSPGKSDTLAKDIRESEFVASSPSISQRISISPPSPSPTSSSTSLYSSSTPPPCSSSSTMARSISPSPSRSSLGASGPFGGSTQPRQKSLRAELCGADNLLVDVLDFPGATDERDFVANMTAQVGDASSMFVIIFSAAHIAGPERKIMMDVTQTEKPFIVLINKQDTIQEELRTRKDEVRKDYADRLGVSPELIFFISAKNKTDIDKVRSYVYVCMSLNLESKTDMASLACALLRPSVREQLDQRKEDVPFLLQARTAVQLMMKSEAPIELEDVLSTVTNRLPAVAGDAKHDIANPNFRTMMVMNEMGFSNVCSVVTMRLLQELDKLQQFARDHPSLHVPTELNEQDNLEFVVTLASLISAEQSKNESDLKDMGYTPADIRMGLEHAASELCFSIPGIIDIIAKIQRREIQAHQPNLADAERRNHLGLLVRYKLRDVKTVLPRPDLTATFDERASLFRRQVTKLREVELNKVANGAPCPLLLAQSDVLLSLLDQVMVPTAEQLRCGVKLIDETAVDIGGVLRGAFDSAAQELIQGKFPGCRLREETNVVYFRECFDIRDTMPVSRCPKNHNLAEFTASAQFKCDSCHAVQRNGAPMIGCRRCNVDFCMGCCAKDALNGEKKGLVKRVQGLGRLLGLCLLHSDMNVVFPAKLSVAMFKPILGIPATLDDLASLEPILATTLRSLFFSDDTFLDELDLNFTVEIDGRTMPLEPGGEAIRVNSRLCPAYLEKRVGFHLGYYEFPMREFVFGVHEIVPQEHLAMFTPAMLQMLVCGHDLVDAGTIIGRATWSFPLGGEEDSKLKEWFGECVRNMAPADISLLLAFITGASTIVPGNNFTITIVVRRAPTDLPVSHTCFNMLELPPYPSREELNEKLLLAIRNTSSNQFGLI